MYDYAFEIISSVNRYKTNTKNFSNSQALIQLYIKSQYSISSIPKIPFFAFDEISNILW